MLKLLLNYVQLDRIFLIGYIDFMPQDIEVASAKQESSVSYNNQLNIGPITRFVVAKEVSIKCQYKVELYNCHGERNHTLQFYIY